MSDETRPAFEAEAKAEGQRPMGRGQEAEANVATLAVDPKAVRVMAKAEAKRTEIRAATEARDADAVRKAEAELASLNAQLVKAEAKAARKAKTAEAKAKARARVASKAATILTTIQSEAAASYSAFVYIVVVSIAVFSQQEVFKTEFQWSQLTALGAAIFIEGTGLAFYATSVSMRLDNRSGLIPRALAWAVTGFAAFMQYNAHSATLTGGMPLLSYALAGASIAALLLAEIRTTHKVGKKLEERDQKDAPQARLGLRFCLRYPRQAWWAVSAMIAIPSIRTRSRALRAGRLIQTLRARRILNESLMQLAEHELKKASKAKASEAVLLRLGEYAYFGLKAIDLQTQLASAPATLAKAEAVENEDRIKAETGQPPKAEAGVLPEAGRRKAISARPKPSAQRLPAPASADSEADSEIEGRPDRQWADRPGNNAFVWEQRLAELAANFPGTADDIPSRQVCIDTMRSRREAGVHLRFAWTNKGNVGFLLNDLKALRSAGHADPRVRDESMDRDGS